MALQRYRIPHFLGINQSQRENDIAPRERPMARNMDTTGGRLSVAKGYVRHEPAP